MKQRNRLPYTILRHVHWQTDETNRIFTKQTISSTVWKKNPFEFLYAEKKREKISVLFVWLCVKVQSHVVQVPGSAEILLPLLLPVYSGCLNGHKSFNYFELFSSCSFASVFCVLSNHSEIANVSVKCRVRVLFALSHSFNMLKIQTSNTSHGRRVRFVQRWLWRSSVIENRLKTNSILA